MIVHSRENFDVCIISYFYEIWGSKYNKFKKYNPIYRNFPLIKYFCIFIGFS